MYTPGSVGLVHAIVFCVTDIKLVLCVLSAVTELVNAKSDTVQYVVPVIVNVAVTKLAALATSTF